MWTYNYTDELYHHGVKGMRWGVRRDKKNYRSTGLKAAIARRQNEKVDKGFKKWEESDRRRDNAIDLGKKANKARMAYDNDPSNKELKSAYKDANKAYKKALSSNTTYRKGVVRKEVGKDASKSYLSEAKKVKKQLDKDPSNKDLQKKYNQLMSKHDVERAAARRATEVSLKRSNKKASIKRNMTIGVSTVATAAAVTAGAYAVNRYLNTHDVTVNGKRVSMSASKLSDIAAKAKKAKDYLGYMY